MKIYCRESIAWRQKEQFSDGVGYSWIDSLKEVAEKEVTDEMMANAKFRFPQNTPQNKEEYRYRTIFEEHFPSETAALTVPVCSFSSLFYANCFRMGRSFQKNE